MIRDPLREVLDVGLRTPDHVGPDAVDAVDRRTLLLARRRFGVGLPPPYVPVPAEPAALPVRRAGPGDGAAVAVVQHRAGRARPRGLPPDALPDPPDLSSLGTSWMARAAADPTPRHRLLVAGGPGQVHAFVDTGPAAAGDAGGTGDGAAGDEVGEVRGPYVDPSVAGRGLGSVLLAAAVDHLVATGFSTAVSWVVEDDAPARAFARRWGWEPDGARRTRPVAGGEVAEVRHRLALRPATG